MLSTNNTLPILDNFLFDVKNGEISIFASDLETTMMCKMSANAQEEENSNSCTLLDTLKTFSSQPLTF